MDVEVMFTPGHTLASIAYLIGDAAFIHDSIFMPDGGTARADFPGGSARALWDSIQRIMALPDDTRLFTGHDYLPRRQEARLGEHGRSAEGGKQSPHKGEQRSRVRRCSAAPSRSACALARA
jgi:glyoxylase-like metal-dependent hydrolase (beta-lactamase superfamily II)